MSLNKRLINTGGSGGGSFDISNLVQVQGVGVGDSYGESGISSNGQWMLVQGYYRAPYYENGIWMYEFTTPYDLSTAVLRSYLNTGGSPYFTTYNGRGVYIDPSGTRCTTTDEYSTHRTWFLGTPGDFNTITGSYGIGRASTQDTSYFADNGTKHYITQYNTSTITRYNSSGFPYRVSQTGGVSYSLPAVSGNWNSMWGMAFNSDGTKMLVNQATDKKTFQYTCSTPFLPSSAVYDGIEFYHGLKDAWFLQISDDDAFVFIGRPGAQYKYEF